jgi:hypothetical protein
MELACINYRENKHGGGMTVEIGLITMDEFHFGSWMIAFYPRDHHFEESEDWVDVTLRTPLETKRSEVFDTYEEAQEYFFSETLRIAQEVERRYGHWIGLFFQRVEALFGEVDYSQAGFSAIDECPRIDIRVGGMSIEFSSHRFLVTDRFKDRCINGGS